MLRACPNNQSLPVFPPDSAPRSPPTRKSKKIAVGKLPCPSNQSEEAVFPPDPIPRSPIRKSKKMASSKLSSFSDDSIAMFPPDAAPRSPIRKSKKLLVDKSAVDEIIVDPTTGKKQSKTKKSNTERHRKRHRRVSFDETHNIFYESPELDVPALKAIYWYSKKDIRQMKDDLKTSYKTIRKANSAETASKSSYTGALLRVHELCRQAQPNNSNNRISSDDCIMSKLPKDARKTLQRVLREQMDRLGLERYYLASASDGPRKRRNSLVVQVVQRHTEQSQNSPLTPLEQAEILRQSCESISLPSRLFAHHTAVAFHKGSSSCRMSRRTSC